MSEQPNAIVLPESLQGSNLVKYSVEDILATTAGSEYLPRFQVVGLNSELVGEKKAVAGNLICIWTKDRLRDLGLEQDVLFITMRPKALRIDKTQNAITQYYDRNSEDFKRIQADSMMPDSGCMFGLEFLVFLPSINEFAGFFCGSKTSRREAPAILDVMTKSTDANGQPSYGPSMVTIKSHFIPRTQGRKYAWYAFKAIRCTTPPAVMPDEEDLIEQVEKFNNPPKSQVEKVEPTGAGTGRET